MRLEAWHNSLKVINLSDYGYDSEQCTLFENTIHSNDIEDQQLIIAMKGCFIVYGCHKGMDVQIIESKQDSDLGILSFQLGGGFNVRGKDFQPYRHFENDLHLTFYSTKRELKFEMPPVFESFRIYLSPHNFLDLLAKFHGRFSSFADKIKRSEPFNLNESPLPITPKMKLIIREVLSHKIGDPLFSKVFYETKITELFGCQLEQNHSVTSPKKHSGLSKADKAKIEQARNLLLNNLAEAPSIRQLSRLVATNEHKLKSGFKEMFGKSIYNYLLHKRIDKSIELLADETLSLEQISEDVGYTESAHFSRAFKKVKGIPPGVFRRDLLSH
ncbi:MAG: helix-turn-helix transcriptional regulator [Prolixibacteraceae bacterium]|nr:helix-turn-helix transcriptional regulator [Prolixibacteraceae bacterium]